MDYEQMLQHLWCHTCGKGDGPADEDDREILCILDWQDSKSGKTFYRLYCRTCMEELSSRAQGIRLDGIAHKLLNLLTGEQEAPFAQALAEVQREIAGAAYQLTGYYLPAGDVLDASVAPVVDEPSHLIEPP